MLSFFRKKKIIPHIKLSGVIGNVGKFKQGIDFSGQEEIISKAFVLKKAPKPIRTVKQNKNPLILSKDYGLKAEPYSEIGLNEIMERAKLLDENPKFVNSIKSIFSLI